MIYTGIGSRQTPADMLKKMQDAARQLANRGWLLRSGGADGADSAFEKGCDQSYGRKEIFLPWYRFNNNSSPLYKIPQEAYDIAATLHERWQFLKGPVRKLHARNIQQILGEMCDVAATWEHSDVVICWTPSGKAVGGTATALTLAYELNIRVINLAIRELDLESL